MLACSEDFFMRTRLEAYCLPELIILPWISAMLLDDDDCYTVGLDGLRNSPKVWRDSLR